MEDSWDMFQDDGLFDSEGFDGGDGDDGFFIQGRNIRMYLIDCHESLWATPCKDSSDRTVSALQVVLQSLVTTVNRTILTAPSDMISIVFYNTREENIEHSSGERGIYVLFPPGRPSHALIDKLIQLSNPATFNREVGVCPSLKGTCPLSSALTCASRLFSTHKSSGSFFLILFTAHDDPAALPLEAEVWEHLSSGAPVRTETVRAAEEERNACQKRFLDLSNGNVYLSAICIPPSPQTLTGILRAAGVRADTVAAEAAGRGLSMGPAAAGGSLGASLPGSMNDGTTVVPSLAPLQTAIASQKVKLDAKADTAGTSSASPASTPFGSLAETMADLPGAAADASVAAAAVAAATRTQASSSLVAAEDAVKDVLFNSELSYGRWEVGAVVPSEAEMRDLNKLLVQLAKRPRVFTRFEAVMPNGAEALLQYFYGPDAHAPPEIKDLCGDSVYTVPQQATRARVQPLFAAKVYLLVSSRKPPSSSLAHMHVRTREQLRSVRQYRRADGAMDVVPREQLASYMDVGGQRVVIPNAVRAAATSGGKAGVALLSFLDESFVTERLRLRSGYFLAADDDRRANSSTSLASLCEAMKRQRVVARARVVLRDGMQARHCLLAPHRTVEELRALYPGVWEDEYQWDIDSQVGLHVHILPSEEDVRDMDAPWSKLPPSYDAVVGKMEQVLDLITEKKSFYPGDYHNSAIERELAELEATVTGLETRSVAESLVPARVIKEHQDEIKALWAEAVEAVQNSMEAAGIKEEAKPVRVKKESSPVDVSAVKAATDLKKLTVDQLKSYCAQVGVKVPSKAKKDDIIQLVRDHLDKSG